MNQMKKGNGFSLRSRLLSFKFAINGWLLFFKHQPNAWIHLFFMVLTVVAGIFFHLSSYEWIALVFAIGLVFLAEMLNSSIERLSDVYTEKFDQGIKETKDLAAGAVLWSAVIAVIIGLIIFLPKCWELLKV